MVGPHYQAPNIPLAPLHNAAAVEERAETRPAPPLDRWWQGFADPALTQAVQQALDQNLDLKAAIARVDQSRALAQAAGAQRLPSGELTAQAVPLRQSLDSPIGSIAQHLPGYTRNQTLYDVGAAASWEIDLFGGLRRSAEATGAQAQATQAEQLSVRITVAAETADAYIQVRGEQQRIALAQEQIDTDAHLLELVRLRVGAGAVADREAAQAEALLSQAKASVPPLRTALEQQMNRLDVLMGAQPGTHAAEWAKPADIPAVPALSAREANVQLLRQRPDVIAAERRLAASNARIGAAVSEYYPKVSLAALLGFESLQSGQLLSSHAFQPEAALGLRWRLFDFGKVDAEVARAKGADAEALALYRQCVLRAAEEVENSLMALVQSEAESKELSYEVAALSRARNASQEDYEAGAIALTDVLDSDRELLTARDDLARSRAASGRAGVAVYRALGAGW